MKKLKKLFWVVACIGGVGALGYYLWNNDKARAKFFNSMYEDTILKLMDVGRLALDLLSWPINFVKALLP